MSTNSDAEANHIHYDATQDKKIHKGMSPAKSRTDSNARTAHVRSPPRESWPHIKTQSTKRMGKWCKIWEKEVGPNGEKD